MADVSIKIQLQDTIEDVIGGVSSNKATNNVSSIISKNTQKNDGTPLLSFALGYIKFDVDGNLVNADEVAGKAILEGTYNGFVFGATNASGEYSVTLTITGSHIDSLIFYGDKLANQFPIEAYLDGDTANKIYSDDSIWAIVFDTSTTSHTVTFTKWNRANYNACFTHIAVLRNELWLDKAWIKNVESVSQCTGQPNEIFYGVIANSGSAEILDRNGELLDYITDGIIENSNLPISIWANGKQVQAHITNDSDYDVNSIALSLEMTNDFENWDKLNYSGYDYPETSKNAYEMLSDVLNSLGYSTIEIDEMLSKEIVIGNSIDNNVIEKSIKEYLQSINIPYPYLEADTIKNTIDKFCVMAQLQVYKNDDNNIEFVSARPNIITKNISNVLIIPAKNEKSQLSETKILKNKYNNINIAEYVVEENDVSSSEAYSQSVYITTTNINESSFDSSGRDTSSDPHYSIAKIEASVQDVSFNIDKLQNNNLTKILSLSQSLKMEEGEKYEANISTAGEVYRYIGSFTNLNQFYQDLIPCDNTSVFATNYYYNNVSFSENPDTLLSDVPIEVRNSGGIDGYFAETSIPKDYVKVIDKGTYFECSGKINTSSITYTAWGAGGAKTQRAIKYLSNDKIVITFSGMVRNIDFVEMNVEDNTNNGTNTLSIQSNKMIQQDTKYSNKKISEIIKNNIKDDYSSGIADASITIACSNYYDINGNLAKDWSKGEIIQVGDIVRIDKDNEGNSTSSYKDGTPKLWRVTGRTFRKQGVPLIDLELQEIRQYFKVVFMNGDEVYATQLVDHGEKATAPSDPTVGTGYAFEGWFTADNQEFNFNTPINQDITLYAKFEPQQVSVTYDISPNTTISIERLSSDKENATIGSITTSDTIYYNDQIKYVVSSSSTYDYIGITINDVDYETSNASLPYTKTITNALQIKTFIAKWTLISKQTVDVNYPNNAGSATTDVVVNNYNSGEELIVNTKLYLHLKNKITNNIDTLNLYIGQGGSDWLTSPGYVPFGWAVPSSIYESYYPFSIDFEFSPQSADSDITITVTKENADDYVSSSGPGMSFYALRKS